MLPDFASVNFSEEGTGDLCQLLLERDIGVEAALWSTADARLLGDLGLACRLLHVLVEVQDPGPSAAVDHGVRIDDVLDRTGREIAASSQTNHWPERLIWMMA